MSDSYNKFSAVYLISFAVLISFLCNVNAEAQYSDLPPPPTKPEKFTSKQQLKEYLVKLHEQSETFGGFICIKFEPTLKRSVCFSANLHCCKWPNIEQKI